MAPWTSVSEAGVVGCRRGSACADVHVGRNGAAEQSAHLANVTKTAVKLQLPVITATQLVMPMETAVQVRLLMEMAAQLALLTEAAVHPTCRVKGPNQA